MEEMNLMPTLAEANLPVPAQQVPPELEEPSPLQKLKAADEARPGFPGEHWLVLALGIAVWQFTRATARWIVRTRGRPVAPRPGGARRQRPGRPVQGAALHALRPRHQRLPAVRNGRAPKQAT